MVVTVIRVVVGMVVRRRRSVSFMHVSRRLLGHHCRGRGGEGVLQVHLVKVGFSFDVRHHFTEVRLDSFHHSSELRHSSEKAAR